MESVDKLNERITELEMFKTVVENLTSGISKIQLDGCVSYNNPAYLQMMGYTEDEMAGLYAIDLMDESPEFVQEAIQQAIEQGIWHGQLTYKRKDGSTFLADVSAVVLRDAEGTPTGIIGSIRDITTQKQMEESVNESQRRYRWLLNNLPGVIVTIVDRDYRIEFIDGRDLISIGVKKEDIEGKLLIEVFGPEIYEYSKPLIDRAIAGETVKSDTLFGDMTYETLYMPYGTDGEEEITKMVSLAVNATESKRMAVEQERLQQEIIDAQKQALKELSTPIIPLFEGVLVMPLIGSIDTTRSRDIMRNLLSGITEHRARTIIVDITGVPLVDTGVADHLNKTIQAARLKGAHTIVTGISDAVAETIVDLGIDWSEVETMRDLQSGLLLALARTGMSLNAN